MNNRYKKTMSKVVVEESFKQDLKHQLSSPKKNNYTYMLRYAVVLIIISFSLAFIILKQIPKSITSSEYVISLEHEYYQNRISYYTILSEKESMTLDLTASFDNDNLLVIQNITPYIKKGVVYSTVTGTRVTTNEKVVFNILGGTITKKQWEETFDYELPELANETYIKILSNDTFELEIDSLYYVDIHEDELPTIHKARKNNSKYEVYDENIGLWISLE